jgi:hypothetical protein
VEPDLAFEMQRIGAGGAGVGASGEDTPLLIFADIALMYGFARRLAAN